MWKKYLNYLYYGIIMSFFLKKGFSFGITTGVITTKNLTVSGAITDSRIYDGGTSAVVDFGSTSLIEIIGSEDVTLDSSGYSATFDNKNVDSIAEISRKTNIVGRIIKRRFSGLDIFLLSRSPANKPIS